LKEEGLLLKEHAAYRLQFASDFLQNKKQYSCKKYNAWNECNTSFNEVKPHSIFFSMAFAFTGGTSLFSKELS